MLSDSGYNVPDQLLYCATDEATIGCTIELKSFTQEMTKTLGLQHAHEFYNCVGNHSNM